MTVGVAAWAGLRLRNHLAFFLCKKAGLTNEVILSQSACVITSCPAPG